MDGKTHAIVGGITGGLVSVSTGNDLIGVETGVLTFMGAFSGLVPDLDTNGMLSNKMTLSYKLINMLMLITGFSLILYGTLIRESFGVENVISVGIGLMLILMVVTKIVTQKKMLMVTGVGVTIAGSLMGVVWIIMFGVYIITASLIGHRTYTHSILGLIYFGIMAYLMNQDLGINGLFMAMVIAYISHLVCDFKIFNKQGVKLFRPFINFEI